MITAPSPDPPIPLESGDAITRWLYTDAQERPFPGPVRPNPDNVSYAFGLVGARPGQSPAREALEARGHARDDAAPPSGRFDKLHVGGLSPNVDFSLFAFVPTLIARAFRCRLLPLQAGAARFRFATCGALRIWLDDALVEQFAPFTHNEESSREVVLDLPARPVLLTVELEELHERNTANYFSFAFLSGVPVSAAVDAPDVARLNAVADLIDTLEARQVFHASGPLALRTEAPLPHDQILSVVAVQQMPRADARERLDIPPFDLTLGAGSNTVHLDDVAMLPTGCTQITVRTVCDGIDITKRIGTTILTRGTPLQGRTVDERKAEALTLGADDTGREATVALVMLAAGRGVDEAVEVLNEALIGIEQRYDCSDFTILPILRIWRDHREALPAALRDRIENAILGYRYWMSEPGNDAMWFWSENHVLCFHVAQLIAGHLFPDRIFTNSGWSGADHLGEAGDRLRRWFDAVERDGLCEVNSAAYYPIDMFALLILHDLSPDRALRQRAADLLDRIFVMTGLHMTGGVPAGAQGRAYEKELLSGQANELGAVAAVAFGGTWFPAYGRAALNFSLSAYTPPAVAARFARPDADRVIEAQYTQGANRTAKLKLWKNRHVQLSTASDHMTGTVGSQQHVVDLQFAHHPMARLWINHPGDRKPWSERRPSKLAGNHWLPRIAQHGRRAFAIYDVPDDPRFVPFVQLFAIAGAFDRIEQRGNHLVFRSGAWSAAIWCSEPLRPETTGPYAGDVRRAEALRTGWVVSLEATPTDAAFAQVLDDVTGRRLDFDPDALTLRANGYELDYAGGLRHDGEEIGFACLEAVPHVSFDGGPLRPWDHVPG